MDFKYLKKAAAGFDLVGVADPFCAELQRAPNGHKPQDYLPGVKSVISLGVRVDPEILQTTPSSSYSHHYDELNKKLNSGAKDIVLWLEQQGYQSLAFPETDSYTILWEQYNRGDKAFVPCFNHLAVAVAAGLGKMGDCGVVLTPQYGPRQRWVSVVTTAAFSFTASLKGEVCLERQGQICGKCAAACPIKAISSKGTDVRRCWIRWTDLRKSGSACGQCIKACPAGTKE